MGLDLSDLVSSAFSILGDAVDDVLEPVLFRQDTGAIVQSTDTGAITRTTTDTAVNVVVASYSLREIVESQRDGAQTTIQPEDAKCLIPAQDLGASIVPTPQDRIVRADASVWNVISVQTDPARALWVLQIRKP